MSSEEYGREKNDDSVGTVSSLGIMFSFFKKILVHCNSIYWQFAHMPENGKDCANAFNINL